LVFLVSCARRESDHSNIEGKVFSIAAWEPENIDPTFANDDTSVTIAKALFEGLFKDAQSKGVRAGMARSWEVSDDGVVWRFFLREDAVWSDGKPVTAYDFVYGIQRALDPKTASRAVPLLFVLEGAEKAKRGGPIDEVGAIGVDEKTLELRLTHPVPNLPNRLTHPIWFPLRKDIVEKAKAKWTDPENIVCNGAFCLKGFVREVSAFLEKSKAYYDSKNVALDGVRFLFTTNDNLAYKWFREGKVMWLKGTLSRDLIPFMRREMPAEFHSEPVACTYYLALNVSDEPLNDSHLRRALAMAVDKEALVRLVLMGGQAEAKGFVPRAISGEVPYTPPEGYGFDPKSARKELALARTDPSELVLLFNTGDVHRLIGEFLQSQWKEHLGISVRLEAVEWKVLLQRVGEGRFVMARASWCADFIDPQDFLDVFRCDAPTNYPHYCNEDYDRLLREAENEKDEIRRLAILRDAEALLLRQIPIVPLYHYSRIYLLSTDVEGFEPNIMDSHPLDLIRLNRLEGLWGQGVSRP
jgi:oligopeptide transport system substrate-binding protein